MIHIKGIAHQFRNPPSFFVDRPEGSGDFLLLYFRTDAEYCPEEQYLPIAAGNFILYEKGAPQRYRKTDGFFINDWMHFDIEPYDNYFENLGIPFNTPISLKNTKVITDIFIDLYIEFFNEGAQHEFIIDYKMNALFHKFSDIYHSGMMKSNSMNKYYGTLARIRQEILEYQYVPSGVGEVASRLNISASYLLHIYKTIFGQSLHQDIIKGRLGHAAQLLLVTNNSVSEIASACGYKNLEHFSRQFKKHYGVSPKKFRR